MLATNPEWASLQVHSPLNRRLLAVHLALFNIKYISTKRLIRRTLSNKVVPEYFKKFVLLFKSKRALILASKPSQLIVVLPVISRKSNAATILRERSLKEHSTADIRLSEVPEKAQ
jgi:hypothetical protein